MVLVKNKKLKFQQYNKASIVVLEIYKWGSYKDWLHIKIKALWKVTLQGKREWDFFLSDELKLVNRDD